MKKMMMVITIFQIRHGFMKQVAFKMNQWMRVKQMLHKRSHLTS